VKGFSIFRKGDRSDLEQFTGNRKAADATGPSETETEYIGDVTYEE
jgi:hypothetical protein